MSEGSSLMGYDNFVHCALRITRLNYISLEHKFLLDKKRSWRAWAAWHRRAHVSAAASPVPRRASTSPATTARPGPPVGSVCILQHKQHCTF